MKKTDTAAPMALAISAWWLWAEANMVIWQRLVLIGMGGAAGKDEARRMVTEKFAANAELALLLATGTYPTPETAAQGTIDFYGKRVSANRKRLARAKL